VSAQGNQSANNSPPQNTNGNNVNASSNKGKNNSSSHMNSEAAPKAQREPRQRGAVNGNGKARTEKNNNGAAKLVNGQ